jgi:hypothetical protein
MRRWGRCEGADDKFQLILQSAVPETQGQGQESALVNILHYHRNALGQRGKENIIVERQQRSDSTDNE